MLTNDQEIIAVRLWNEAAPITTIAHYFGVRPFDFFRYASARPDKFPRRHCDTPAAAAKIAAPPVSDPGRLPPKAPGSHGLPGAFLLDCQCSFPLWGDNERPDPRRSLFCGEPVQGRGPYCTFHAEECSGSTDQAERAEAKVSEVFAAVIGEGADGF